MHLFGASVGQLLVRVPAGTTRYNYNLFSEAGSPNYRVDVVFELPTDSIIGSTTSAPAFYTGIAAAGLIPGWVVGSTLLLRIYGSIEGRGGSGNGNPGSHAISLGWPVLIENYGYILGGGGGGAVGIPVTLPSGITGCGGGGGGGGQGNLSGGLGLANNTGIYGYFPADDGSPGDRITGPGGGGAGGRDIFYNVYGGSGGEGGNWGQAGSASSPNSSGERASGGAAGYAIKRNASGNTVTWAAGYSGSSHVKGLVGI